MIISVESNGIVKFIRLSYFADELKIYFKKKHGML